MKLEASAVENKRSLTAEIMARLEESYRVDNTAFVLKMTESALYQLIRERDEIMLKEVRAGFESALDKFEQRSKNVDPPKG